MRKILKIDSKRRQTNEIKIKFTKKYKTNNDIFKKKP